MPTTPFSSIRSASWAIAGETSRNNATSGPPTRLILRIICQRVCEFEPNDGRLLGAGDPPYGWVHTPRPLRGQ